MNNKLCVVIAVALATLIGLVLAHNIGVINLGFRIEPQTSESPTLNPNTIQLDLGNFISNEAKELDFGKVGELTVLMSTAINFTLDLDTVEHFKVFSVSINFFNITSGDYVKTVGIAKHELTYTTYAVFHAGTYEMRVQVSCAAENITETKTGEIKISISY